MSLQHGSPQLLARPQGKHCAWLVLTSFQSPAPGSAPLTFSGAQRRANGTSARAQGDGTGASHCPGTMDRAQGGVPLTWVCSGQGAGDWERVLPAPCQAAAPRLGWGGRAAGGLFTCPVPWFACRVPPGWELPLPLSVCLKITH